MGECPFCGSDIDGDLLVFGGTCPKCFGEIPGEEAPTDPGEETRMAQEKSDRAGFRKRALFRLALSAALFFALIGMALVFIFRPEPVLPVIDFDKGMVEQPTTLVAWAGPDEAPDEAAPKQGPKPQGAGPRTGPKLTAEQFAVNSKLGEDEDLTAYLGTAPKEQGGTLRGTRSGSEDMDIGDVNANLNVASAGVTTGGVSLGGVNVDVSRRRNPGERITSDAEIFAHVKLVMDMETPKLRQCYQQALKINEDLQGNWRIDYVVDRDHGVKGIQVTGLQMKDAGFEECVAAKIAKWQFNPLRADQPVRKTLTFRQR
ncbi:MAG: AgmX/PglI C-terminal domain-containing protein [Deltaproteobacteria bacterium]|nr:AgmX/PglI C-terminal domain-containing protein [Deltaproteobacteria bacterium]